MRNAGSSQRADEERDHPDRADACRQKHDWENARKVPWIAAVLDGYGAVGLDMVRWDYYKEIGFDEEEQRKINETEGINGVLRYWKRFEIHALERLLTDHHDCVIDLGAGHSVFEERDLFERAEKALQPFPKVILLLPSPDPDESIAILNARRGEESPELDAANAHFVHHPSNSKLAKFIVYTKGKTPKQTRDDVLAAIAER